MTWTPHGDADLNPNRYNYFYIHNVFGHFVKDTLDYFADYLYPRFGDWKIVGTYDKAVEYLNKQTQHGRETDQPLRPALILDPSGDFGPDESFGKMGYRYPNLMPGFAKYVWDPIYQDQNILINVAFGRIVGEFNFIALLSSFYEYTDMRMYLNLVFGGLDRFIYPQWFNSFIILPPEIYNYEYINDVTHETYTINLEDSYNTLVKTTNQNEVVYPCNIKPRYKLTGISDASSRLGGPDNLPDWKLNFTIAYEIEMPTYLILKSDYLAERMELNIGYESCYTVNNIYSVGSENPVNIDTININIDHGLDSTSNSEIGDVVVTIGNKISKLFKTRYYHIVTQGEADSTSVIYISLPEPVIDINLIRLNGKYGNLKYYDHYTIDSTGLILTIDKHYVELDVGDVLEIYIYEYMT
jgi:hypothetical protein